MEEEFPRNARPRNLAVSRLIYTAVILPIIFDQRFEMQGGRRKREEKDSIVVVDDESIDLTSESKNNDKNSKRVKKDQPKWMECIVCLDPIKQPTSTK